MKNSWHRSLLPTTLLISGLALLPATLRGQDAACPSLVEIIEEEATKRAAELLANPVPPIVDDLPLTSPSVKQLGAPGAHDTGTSVVSGPDFSKMMGMAAESDASDVSSLSRTFDLNLFALTATLRPQVLDRQSEYEKYETIRRFGGAVTLGGKGESFDRDGDGTADDALDAKELSDIVNWEFRWRLWGSRDRRDRSNVGKFFQRTSQQFDTNNQSFRNLTGSAEFLRKDLFPNNCPDREKIVALLHSELADKLEALAETMAPLNTSIDSALEEIDSSMIWTLVVGGVSRKDEFGPDKQMAALRGAYGIPGRQFTANLEWSRTEDKILDSRPTTLKAGLEYKLDTIRAFSSSEAVNLSFSGVYERYREVPTAAHDTVAKAGIKLEYPLTKEIKIPLSVTWTNHADLLTDEEEIRGHIGFTIDTSSLFEHITQ